MKTMTEGKPLKLILTFALPLLLGNLFQQTYNIVDAAIVGRYLGANALAGVGASSSVQFLVLGFCTGSCCGFGIPVAQRFGAGDHKGMRDCIFHALVITGIMAAIVTIACAILCPQILHMLSTPENIFDNAYSYLLILFLGIPFTLLYNLLSAILRAVGDSRTPFLFLTVSTALNVILDLIAIIALNMGCAGAALATILSQAISGLLCLRFILKHFPLLWLHRDNCRLRADVTKTVLIMGIPMGLQSSVTAIGSMVMQTANNRLGSIYVSGFTAGMRIKQFAMCPFDALSTAVSTFAGQNVGARRIDRVRTGLRQGIAVGVLYGAAAGLMLIFFGRTLSMIFISAAETDVLDASARYLRSMGFFYWVLGFLAVARMTTQGLGYSGLAVFSGAVEMLARVLVSLIFVPKYGYAAICFTDQSAWVSATLYITPVCLWCVRRIARKLENAPASMTSKETA